MGGVFLKVFNMSLAAGWLILAVILFRAVFRRAPKWIHCLSWGLAAIRLMMPCSIQSVLSLLPSVETINTTMYQSRPYIQSGVAFVDRYANRYMESCYAEGITVPAGYLNGILNGLALLWLAGIAGILAYGIVSYLRLRKEVQPSLQYQGRVYYCDSIRVPFIFGIISPRIYLPSDITQEQTKYVLKHEDAHLKRKDYIWKSLGFLLVAVYWFHPLIWAGYILLCRDIEKACDQKCC